MKQEITDVYGRTFRTLRLSLTNSCNLGCIYCVHTNGEKPAPPKKVIGYRALAEMVKKIHEFTQLETVRLTGGEPTLYKDLIPLVHELTALGIPAVKMTSNGSLLKPLIPGLYKAGLKSINISLDTVDEKSFQQLSGRKNISAILDAIDEALAYGMEIKLNAVVLKTVNEDQILPLLRFASERSIALRFLELMRMGPLYQDKKFEQYFFSEQEILERIRQQTSFTALPRKKSATANYWRTAEGFKFGIIANESSPFCQDCNRLRLDSFGNLFGCLSNSTPIAFADVLENDLLIKERLAEALSQKQPVQFTGSALSMRAIGG